MGAGAQSEVLGDMAMIEVNSYQQVSLLPCQEHVYVDLVFLRRNQFSEPDTPIPIPLVLFLRSLLKIILLLELVPSLVQRAKHGTANHDLFRGGSRWQLVREQSVSIFSRQCRSYNPLHQFYE